MAISHEAKLIFIHIPKNAGVSIKEALNFSFWGHEDWRQLKKQYDKFWDEYTKFAIVRNPWDRAVSCYESAKMEESFWHTRNKRTVEGKRLRVHPDYNVVKSRSFLETLKLLKEGALRGQHWAAQSAYIVDDSNKIVVDKVIRLENLIVEWGPLMKEKGLLHKLKFLNQSFRKKDYHKYYCEESIELIRRYYGDDIRLFGYHF